MLLNIEDMNQAVEDWERSEEQRVKREETHKELNKRIEEEVSLVFIGSVISSLIVATVIDAID